MTETGAWHRTLCPYCGVGCGLLVRVEDGAVVRTKGDPAHPANFGDICAKAVHLPPVLLISPVLADGFLPSQGTFRVDM